MCISACIFNESFSHSVQPFQAGWTVERDFWNTVKLTVKYCSIKDDSTNPPQNLEIFLLCLLWNISSLTAHALKMIHSNTFLVKVVAVLTVSREPYAKFFLRNNCYFLKALSFFLFCNMKIDRWQPIMLFKLQ